MAKSLRLQTESSEDGGVEANMYTGMYVLEDVASVKQEGGTSYTFNKCLYQLNVATITNESLSAYMKQVS